MPRFISAIGRRRITRRQFLRSSRVGASAVLILSACRAPMMKDPARASTVLRFLDTKYDSGTTRQLIMAFQQAQPNRLIQRDEITPERLEVAFTAEQAAGTPRDLAFIPTLDLTIHLARGWLRDLTLLPGASALAGAAFPFVNEQTHRNGRRYAVPAWIRLRGFFYNRTYLETVGQTTPPRSFDEVHAVAQAIKRKHLGNYPFFWPIKNGLGIFTDEFVASGHPMFDIALTPAFLGDPIYRKVIDWRLQAYYNWEIVDPRGLNSVDLDQSFPHGWASFTWDTFDSLRYWQTSGRYRAGGNLANAPCPSWTDRHDSVAEVDFYVIPSSSVQVDPAWELARFLGGDSGGDYRAARQRWHSTGLVFSYQALLDDPDLLRAAADWCDVQAFRAQLQQAIAPPGAAAPGYVEWLSDATIQSSLLLRQTITPHEFVRRLDTRWTALRVAKRA